MVSGCVCVGGSRGVIKFQPFLQRFQTMVLHHDTIKGVLRCFTSVRIMYLDSGHSQSNQISKPCIGQGMHLQFTVRGRAQLSIGEVFTLRQVGGWYSRYCTGGQGVPRGAAISAVESAQGRMMGEEVGEGRWGLVAADTDHCV